MALPRADATQREWFCDPRSPDRRMGVSTHVDRGIVVISHWQGATCVSTFQLPIADSARVIAALAEGMAAALPTAPGPKPIETGWRQKVTGWVRRATTKSSHGAFGPLRLIGGHNDKPVDSHH